MKKRMMSLLLALALLVGMFPSSAFAAGGLLRAFAVNAVNATVYNEDGEVIKAAYPGDTVRVVGTPPVTSAQTFNGWTVETADVQYTENGQELTFVMPSKAVNITANYLDWCVDSVCFDIDVFIVGDSIPFDISISDNGVDTIGYTLGVPDGIDTSVTYNNIRWYDNTQKSYCRPGDVFQKGHEYTVYIGIMAEENCCFESGADLTVDFGYYGTKSGLGSEYSSFDSTKWLMVSKGNIKPAAGIFDIELKNAVAYDSDGNSITKALSGEAVTVSISKPLNGCGDFDKWIVEPSSLEYTFKNGIFSFVMPECDVSLTADFKSLEISNVYIYIGGPFSAGDEIPFTFSTIDGQMWHIGYGAGAPPTADTTNFYNNMSWFDATAEEYKKPGDVFEDGHEYNLTVNIKANEYCHFADAFQMTVSFGKYGISDYTPGTYAGEDESKYIYVQLDGVKTYKEYSIALKNCIARNDAGESITSALPGESVNVVLNAPLQCGDFLGWSISPDIEYTIEYGILKFTMPYDDVEVTADFDTMVCNKIYLDIGKDYMPGDEIPFAAYFMDGQMYYTGYDLKAPAGIDSSVIYNGISWLDTTTGEYAKPGDKFKADHVYKAIIHLTAVEYRHFDALENMELKIAYLQNISAELHEYDNADPSRWLYATVDNITTVSVPKKQINITNGVAYNADGEGDQEVPVCICVNKCDLDPAQDLARIYRNAGFTVIQTSAETGEGVEELRQLLQGKLAAFTGNSGVGKSSILNRLCPQLQLATGEVSDKLGRGRHTTRHVQLYQLDEQTYVADTPGFSSFDTDQMDVILKENLQFAFPDFGPYIGCCQFHDCSHRKEPGCAVRAALENGILEPTRYDSYLRLYEKSSQINAWELK